MDTSTCTVNSYSASTVSCVPVSLCPCVPVPLCPCVLCPCVHVWSALHCLVLCIDKENGRQTAYSCLLIFPHFGLVVATVWGLQAMHGPQTIYSSTRVMSHRPPHVSLCPLISQPYTEKSQILPTMSLCKTLMYAHTCRPMYVYKLLGDTSRSHDS